MGRKSAGVRVLTHGPETEAEARTLAHLASVVHADAVIRYIQKLNCPARQKLKLLDAVVNTAEK